LISKPIISIGMDDEPIQWSSAEEDEEYDIFNLNTLQSIIQYIENMIKNHEIMTNLDKELIKKLDKDFLLTTIGNSLELI
jgi:hypothetical protein